MIDQATEKTAQAILKERSKIVDNFFGDYLLKNVPVRLKDSILYSLQAGGKRLRPVLCITWSIIGGDTQHKCLPFAAAIEMIHTYSLIHDDLPAMDDDDFRRGKLSNHKAFDEATAILAGDGLLTDAFYILLETPCANDRLIRAAKELVLAAGSSGMVGGQMLDMQYTGKGKATMQSLAQMQNLKTGVMIRASCLCGAIIGGGSDDLCIRAARYGAALGKAFQITDDILDETGDPQILGKPVKSDQKQGKLTWPALVGIDASRKEAEHQIEIAVNALESIESPEKKFLTDLALYVIRRSS